MSTITLSEQSVGYIVKLCKKFEMNNPANSRSIEMADGIAHYVKTHSYISQKQAEWLCRNADYWKSKRPTELKDIVITGKKQRQPNDEAFSQHAEDILMELMRRVKRIEKILETRLPL